MNIACQQNALLILSGDINEVRFVSSAATRAGWRTLAYDSPQALIGALRGEARTTSAVLIDHALLGESAGEFLRELERISPNLPVVVITDSPSAETSAGLIRAGATDYLARPLERDRLIQSLRLAACRDLTPRELRPLSEELQLPSRFEAMIGSDPAFREALARAAKAARTHRNVVVQGEVGTGKDTLLRAMHSASPRAGSPLEVLRVRAFTAASLESALFGHEAGAFAGAFARQVGALEKSDGGTLVIEEINRLPLEVQRRLAESIAHARVTPLGASHSFRVDVRILAASNQPVAEMLDGGTLDAGLYDALAAFEIALPPLRQRRGDIPALARYFLTKINEQLGVSDLILADGAVSRLSSFDWPGNLRQLQAVLFRAAASCEGEVLKAGSFGDLSTDRQPNVVPILQLSPARGGILLFGDDGHLRSLDEIETDIIRLAIGHYRGRMSEVARRLGIGRSTLYRKLAELDLETTL